MLIEKTLKILGRDSQKSDGLNITTLLEEDKSSIGVISSILKVPYVVSRDDFEKKYMASYVKEIGESDEDYQNRLVRLNENKLIPAINKETEKRILFCIDQQMKSLIDFVIGNMA